MSIFLQPLQTVTLSSSTNSINFTNIPQTFTDLKIEISARSDRAINSPSLGIKFNNDSASNYSKTVIYGNGGAGSYNSSNNNEFDGPSITGSSDTANTFSNSVVYIANYANSNYKSIITDSVIENNSSTSGTYLLEMMAGLWRNTAAISSINIFENNGNNLISGTKFSLYGVLRSGI